MKIKQGNEGNRLIGEALVKLPCGKLEINSAAAQGELV